MHFYLDYNCKFGTEVQASKTMLPWVNYDLHTKTYPWPIYNYTQRPYSYWQSTLPDKLLTSKHSFGSYWFSFRHKATYVQIWACIWLVESGLRIAQIEFCWCCRTGGIIIDCSFSNSSAVESSCCYYSPCTQLGKWSVDNVGLTKRITILQEQKWNSSFDEFYAKKKRNEWIP